MYCSISLNRRDKDPERWLEHQAFLLDYMSSTDELAPASATDNDQINFRAGREITSSEDVVVKKTTAHLCLVGNRWLRREFHFASIDNGVFAKNSLLSLVMPEGASTEEHLIQNHTGRPDINLCFNKELKHQTGGDNEFR